MDGIILIDKEKNMTSRDVVNIACQKLHTRHIGHTGTLDPIATGLMVLCVNDGCKLVEMLTSHDKEYIAKVRLGIKTDTYDVTGNIKEENNNFHLTFHELEETLNSFCPEYLQEVPIYSAIKVNGKKLYDYARSGIAVNLPSHLVKINNIKLLNLDSISFSFKISVSSGFYIRSLVNDIGNKLNIPMSLEELRRTKVGDYKIEDADTLDNLHIIPIIDSINFFKIEVDDLLYKKVKNGVKIKNIYNKTPVMFVKDNKPIAIYKDDNGILKSYRVFQN